MMSAEKKEEPVVRRQPKRPRGTNSSGQNVTLRMPRELLAEIDELASGAEPPISRSLWIVRACYDLARKEREESTPKRRGGKK
jgi:hypothetical protein